MVVMSPVVELLRVSIAESLLVYFLSLPLGNACYLSVIVKDGVPLPTRERSYWRLGSPLVLIFAVRFLAFESLVHLQISDSIFGPCLSSHPQDFFNANWFEALLPFMAESCV